MHPSITDILLQGLSVPAGGWKSRGLRNWSAEEVPPQMRDLRASSGPSRDGIPMDEANIPKGNGRPCREFEAARNALAKCGGMADGKRDPWEGRGGGGGGGGGWEA